jgi:tRNA threonylcarbamoyladenosine biosynthesis protein TsaE
MRTTSVEKTLELGARVGAALQAGDVLARIGPLGAGKTHFTKGVALGLGVDAGTVNSPTFVLMNCYKGRLPVYHFDAYRLAGPDDMENLGCEHLIGGDGVALIEWADRVAGWLPADVVTVRIEVAGDTERSFCFESPDRDAGSLMVRLKEAVATLAE